jgi:hypothetical protein
VERSGTLGLAMQFHQALKGRDKLLRPPAFCFAASRLTVSMPEKHACQAEWKYSKR